jgi:hypothetical protein
MGRFVAYANSGRPAPRFMKLGHPKAGTRHRLLPLQSGSRRATVARRSVPLRSSTPFRATALGEPAQGGPKGGSRCRGLVGNAWCDADCHRSGRVRGPRRPASGRIDHELHPEDARGGGAAAPSRKHRHRTYDHEKASSNAIHGAEALRQRTSSGTRFAGSEVLSSEAVSTAKWFRRRVFRGRCPSVRGAASSTQGFVGDGSFDAEIVTTPGRHEGLAVLCPSANGRAAG